MENSIEISQTPYNLIKKYNNPTEKEMQKSVHLHLYSELMKASNLNQSNLVFITQQGGI